MELIRKDFVIVGLDLNFTLGRSEVWGATTNVDPLLYFFVSKLQEVGLFDIEAMKLQPTWCSIRIGEERMDKKLDRFLVTESPLGEVLRSRQ